jgi:hypothetical protein
MNSPMKKGKGWYHCGRCGSFFLSDLGMEEDRLCADCGLKAATGIWPGQGNRINVRDRNMAVFEKTGESLAESGRRAVRKKRKNSTTLKFIVCWAVLMSLLVWKLRFDTRHKAGAYAATGDKAVNLAEGTMADERIAFLSRALPDCHRALIGFLTGGAPEIRNQFVADPIETAGIMAGFYKNNPFPSIEVAELRRTGQQPIKVGEEWMIETRWNDGKGQKVDALFRRNGSVWKLDWEHFIRYGGYSWPLFLAGEGPAEVEFRLLARRVTTGEKAEADGSRLRFTLLSPVFGRPAEFGVESPEFVVNSSSDEGLLLGAAFDAKRSGKPIFGRELSPMEPGNLIRVRVRIKRGEFAGARSFELEEVMACHWIGGDDLGFDLKKLKDDFFTAD